MQPDDCCIGTTTRGMQLAAPVMLSRADRAQHLHLIGATGVGKTTLLRTLMYHDLAHGQDFALLDPLGGLAEAIVDAVPVALTERVIFWDPGGDLEQCLGFNPLYRVPRDRRHLAADGIVSSIMHIWNASLEDAPRMAYLLYNATRLLLDDEDEVSTLLGMPRVFVDDNYRARLLRRCRDPVVAGFWETEFARYDERFRTTAISSVQNKLGMLLSPPPLRNVLGQRRSTLDLSRLMNNGGILICNLAKGHIGQTGANLLGSLIASSIAQVAEQRVSIPFPERRPFTMYTDELQNYATASFATVLSEARNNRLFFAGGHQYLSQLPESVRDALIANAATKVVFRVSSDDGRRLAQDLDMENATTLASTPNHQAWVRLMRHGMPSQAMLVVMEEPDPPARGRARAVKAQSNALHTRARGAVEQAIANSLVADPEPRRSQRAPAGKPHHMQDIKVRSAAIDGKLEPPASPSNDPRSLFP